MTKFNVIQKKRRAQKRKAKRKIHGDPLTEDKNGPSTLVKQIDIKGVKRMVEDGRHAPLMNRELLESLFEPTLASGDEMFNHKHPIPMTNPPNDDVAKVQNIKSDGDEDNPDSWSDYFPNVTICGDYDPYTSQDVPMDDTQYNPSHDILSDNEESPTYVQNTPADGPPNQRQPDPLVKSIGELVEMVKAETMGDKKLVDEGDACSARVICFGFAK
ncbi:hypothetical protein IFM89_023235 [Coptis chinensis]|uniref:Uncharacterized protein n=1 Tax=Coptis chinensis TaxID=261450 RepID=A0A835IXD1_9MAGN|nr:hypothetical protein IFM89_023235 [Coptis chinensis]